MFKWSSLEFLGMPRRDFLLVFNLLFNAFTWSYMAFMVLAGAPLGASMLSAFDAVFRISAVGAGLSGALLSAKVKRSSLLYFWMILGFFSSFLLTFIYAFSTTHLSLVSILLGISFGFGMPSSLAYLGDLTSVEHRGLVGSIIFLLANLSTFIFAVLFLVLNPVISAIVLTAWRGLSIIGFAMLKTKQESVEVEKKPVSYINVFRQRPFSLYLLPWVMFTLVDAFEKALLQDFFGPEFHRFIITTEPIISVFFIFIGGLFGDRIGRKRIVIYGFVTLGIGYAIMGLAPTERLAWYFYTFVDGAAWGLLLTMFLLTLWGDLSQPGTREKYYAIGSIPFIVRSIIPLPFVAFIASVPVDASFSLASFFLFLAVLPLIYAPETLPEKNIELRRVKGYIEQAKKVKEKYFKKK